MENGSIMYTHIHAWKHHAWEYCIPSSCETRRSCEVDSTTCYTTIYIKVFVSAAKLTEQTRHLSPQYLRSPHCGQHQPTFYEIVTADHKGVGDNAALRAPWLGHITTSNEP